MKYNIVEHTKDGLYSIQEVTGLPQRKKKFPALRRGAGFRPSEIVFKYLHCIFSILLYLRIDYSLVSETDL